jgi:hypothetical protein
LSAADHILVIAMEHLISDGLSIEILWRDTWALYSQILVGEPISLPQIGMQYGDYALWQNHIQDHWIEAHQPYWDARLAGARLHRLPATGCATDQDSPPWASAPVRFGTQLTDELTRLSERQQTTLVMTVLTIYFVLILHECSAPDVVLQFTTGGRLFPEVENTVGFFASAVRLRVASTGVHSFLDLQQQVMQEYAEACAHDDLGKFAIDPSQSNLLQTFIFNWVLQGEMPRTVLSRTPSELELQPFAWEGLDPSSGFARMNWRGEPALVLWNSASAVAGHLSYRRDRLSPEFIDRLLASFVRLAHHFATSPHLPLSEAPYRVG